VKSVDLNDAGKLGCAAISAPSGEAAAKAWRSYFQRESTRRAVHVRDIWHPVPAPH
jgi:hypothetical protein